MAGAECTILSLNVHDLPTFRHLPRRCAHRRGIAACRPHVAALRQAVSISTLSQQLVPILADRYTQRSRHRRR
jgi:hypothetical protein